MSLASFQTAIRELSLMQSSWQTELNPLLANPVVNGNILETIILASGANVVNHLLGRQMQGWFLIDLNASVTIYRSAAMNDKTLTLTSSGAATVNLYVF